MEHKTSEGYVAEMQGILIRKNDDVILDEQTFGFASKYAVKSWRNKFNEHSDETEYQFIGIIRIVKDEFKRIHRSNFGKGADFKYDIKEYNGQYCYIPTSGNCFIKCVNYLNSQNKV